MTDIAVRSGLVLDDDDAPERPRHVICNQPRIGIDGSSGRQWNEHPDGSRRILRPDLLEAGEATGQCRRGSEEVPSVHVWPSRRKSGTDPDYPPAMEANLMIRASRLAARNKSM